LTPEIADRAIKTVLEKYGEVKDIMAETWGRAYRYSVNNGIRAATMALVIYMPSRLIVEGHRSLVSYDGQPTTCYGCNAIGHMYTECPKRKRLAGQGVGERRRTWADVVTGGEPLKAQMELVSEGRKDDTEESQMEQMTHAEGLPDAKQQRQGDGGVISSNKQTEEKQETKESVEMDTFADTTRDSMMVDDSSQDNPRDEKLE
jgi:hypothetical protein